MTNELSVDRGDVTEFLVLVAVGINKERIMEKMKTLLSLPFILVIWFVMGFHAFGAWFKYGRKRP
jgi:hypothetical protein